MNLSRTDLAVETAEALPTGRDMFAPGTGVTKSECLLCGCPVTRIHVHTPAGARAIGKPEGRYITIDLRPALSRQEALTGRAALCLCRELRALLPPPSDGPALVVGLGNQAITPDNIGPGAVAHTLATRHLVSQVPEHFGHFRPVSALAAGVLASTGVESSELVRAVADKIDPACVIAIDALASRSLKRVCRTVQLSDTGIVPGSGVGNHRCALNEDTLHVPVLSIGIPTVIDGATLAADLLGADRLPRSAPGRDILVTPRDIDRQVRELGRVLGYALTWALQDLDLDAITSLLG